MRRVFVGIFIIALIIAIIIVMHIGWETNELTSIYELNGKKVGVQTATLYEEYLLKKVPDAQIVFYDDYSNMLTSLKQGKVDAIIAEENIFRMMEHDAPGIYILDGKIDEMFIGIIAAEDARSRNIFSNLQDYIAKYISDGTKDNMQKYWLKEFDVDSCVVDKSGITGENGVVSVAVEAGFVPFSYFVRGELQGYDVDFIYHFCREYGYSPKFMNMTFNSISPAVGSGKCNLGTGIVIAAERSSLELLSDSYYEYAIVCIGYHKNIEKESLIDILKNGFYKTFIKEARWKMFTFGLLITLLICVLSVIIGTLLGIGIYILCFDNIRSINRITDNISWIIHGIPTIVLLMVIYYVIFSKIQVDVIVVSVIGFIIVFTFTMYDMISSGVKAVGLGQYEAARAQGFSSIGAFFYIIFPQATHFFMPTYKKEVISLLKETSVVGYIGVLDLTRMSDLIRSRTFDALFPLLTSTLIYLLVICFFTRLINRMSSNFYIQTRNVKFALRDIRLR